ncbi:MAG: FAD-dependent oxidoreductase [Clostridiales bacterium]|nr:FAD-dependent oxidoreductase [Clostridiales bacterium]
MLDVIIIGGGPAGLGAAIYAKRAGLQTLVIEENIYGAGQISESGRVDNYLGSFGVSGYALSERFTNHARQMEIPILEDRVIEITHNACDIPHDVQKTKSLISRQGQEDISQSNQDEDKKDGSDPQFTVQESGWQITLLSGEIRQSKAIIYAAGATHRRLGAEGEDTFSGRGVSYCSLCDGTFFAGQDVAVVGGGNAALDDALFLSNICRKVYLIHRRNEFRGFSGTLETIREKENIYIITPHRVVKISGKDKLESILLDDGQEIAVNGLFIAVGIQPATELLKDIVPLNEDGYVLAEETGKTSTEGFFVAGDVRKKELRQVITSVADGANAAMSAFTYIRNQ